MNYGQQSGQYGDGVQLPLINQTAPTSETGASATYTGAANAGFILYSKLLGTAGNAITYTITTAADDNLAIRVAGNAITIALANTTASKNTATLVKAAIEAKAEANALVAVVLTGTGAGVVATQSVASLTGGLNGTPGYLGEVIFDTAGNRWEMIWTNGTAYYWSPEVFPAENTEYVAYVENGVVVWKKRIVDNWGTYSNQKVIAISDTDIDVRGLSGRVYVNETISLSLPAGFVNNNIIYTCRIASKRNLITWVTNDAGYFGKPFILDMLYVKV